MPMPEVSEEDLEANSETVDETIDDNWVSFSGKFVQFCENKLKDIFNMKHVLLTSSGTAATHCIIKAIKYKYPNCKKIYIQNNIILVWHPKRLHEIIRFHMVSGCFST